MENNPPSEPTMDQQQADVSEVPPKKDPQKAAGSLNPKEKTAFYEGVVRKSGNRFSNPPSRKSNR